MCVIKVVAAFPQASHSVEPQKWHGMLTRWLKCSIADIKKKEAKDNCYLESVTNDGGDFIPLVCKSFGVWYPFALSTLTIADHTTIKNGLSWKLARRQLLQQLSVA